MDFIVSEDNKGIIPTQTPGFIGVVSAAEIVSNKLPILRQANRSVRSLLVGHEQSELQGLQGLQGLDYKHPPSAAGLVACRSMSELMTPVIAVVGTCLVPPLAMGRPSSPGVAACGRRTANHACTAEVS